MIQEIKSSFWECESHYDYYILIYRRAIIYKIENIRDITEILLLCIDGEVGILLRVNCLLEVMMLKKFIDLLFHLWIFPSKKQIHITVYILGPISFSQFGSRVCLESVQKSVPRIRINLKQNDQEQHIPCRS